MEDVYALDSIDVELDSFFTRKQVSRCKDEFLNTLCEEYDEEEENISVHNTDARLKYALHNPKAKWNKMKPIRGEMYETPQQLKLCLTNYSIGQGYQVRFKKSACDRVVAICARDPVNCPFLIRASYMSTEKTFQVQKIVDLQTCVRNYNNSALMNPTWLARQFVKELIRIPNLKCKEMHAIVLSKFHCKVSWSKCYRARCRALSLIHGKLSDHYAKVWDYGHQLLRSNPDSTFRILVSMNPDNTTTFQRIYICFNAIKEGWKRACCRVVGLDGSFLKGQCMGELLTAIGRDSNNQVYPSLPLLTMLEEIRLYLMERLYNLKEKTEKWDGNVCPAANGMVMFALLQLRK